MNLNDFITEIDALAHNAKGDHAAEDFIEAANKAIQIIEGYKQQAQDNIINNIESLVDSFGGKDCTMRELKGE